MIGMTKTGTRERFLGNTQNYVQGNIHPKSSHMKHFFADNTVKLGYLPSETVFLNLLCCSYLVTTEKSSLVDLHRDWLPTATNLTPVSSQ